MKKSARTWLLFAVLFTFFTLTAPFDVTAAPSESLAMTKLLFVDDVAGLGQYTPKQGGRFAIGDMCSVYIETVGFTLEPKPDSEDEFDIDLAVDVAIKMPRSRRTIISEKDFNTLQTIVRSQLPVNYLAFSFRFDAEWDPGSYIIEFTLRDNLSGQSVTGELEYLLEDPTEEDLVRQMEENQVNEAD